MTWFGTMCGKSVTASDQGINSELHLFAERLPAGHPIQTEDPKISFDSLAISQSAFPAKYLHLGQGGRLLLLGRCGSSLQP